MIEEILYSKYCLNPAAVYLYNWTTCNWNENNVIYFITSTAHCTAIRHNHFLFSGIFLRNSILSTPTTYKCFNVSVMVTAVSTASRSVACLLSLCSLGVSSRQTLTNNIFRAHLENLASSCWCPDGSDLNRQSIFFKLYLFINRMAHWLSQPGEANTQHWNKLKLSRPDGQDVLFKEQFDLRHSIFALLCTFFCVFHPLISLITYYGKGTWIIIHSCMKYHKYKQELHCSTIQKNRPIWSYPFNWRLA